MHKHLFYLLALATLLFTASCKEDDEIPAPATVGMSFVSAADTINLNTETNTATVVVNVNADITKAELEKRLKLNFTSEDAVQGTHYRVVSTEINESPLQVVLQIEALPSLARQEQIIQISFDSSMQPITVGDNGTFDLTIIPHSPALGWYEAKPYYFPYVYYHNVAENKWQSIGAHFSTVPGDDYAVLGFTNPYVDDSGVALFNMVRLYSSEIGSTNVKTAKINAPKVLEFIPASAGATEGTVNVIPQDVTITRADGTTFNIGISGEGTYNLETRLIDLVVDFDESAIGGPAKVSRTYKISYDRLTL